MRFIRRSHLAKALGVAINTTFLWERRGTLPAATKLAPNVAGWWENQLPEGWLPLFEESPKSSRDTVSRDHAARQAAEHMAEVGR